MRTLGSLLPNKQYKIAGETLYIYAPLANRLGLNKIKTELENLSFKYEHQEEYQGLKKSWKPVPLRREEAFNLSPLLSVQLDKMGLKYRIIARVKSIYSIWNKMQTKHVPLKRSLIYCCAYYFDPRNEEEELNDCFDICIHIQDIQTASRQIARLGKPPQSQWLSGPSMLRWWETTGNGLKCRYVAKEWMM